MKQLIQLIYFWLKASLCCLSVLECMETKYSLEKETVKCITEKGPVMVNHLLECDYCLDNIKKKAWAFKDGKELDSDAEPDHLVDVASHILKENGKRLSAFGGHAGNVKKKKQVSLQW